MGLENHFGTEPAADLYGPKPPLVGAFNLRRRGVAQGGVPITPILNFEKEIFPPHVKAGQLLNTSYDAGKIIKPEIARPKAEVKADIQHQTVVKTPVQLGSVREEKKQLEQ